jgi:sugar (pentulose or hexulose) kinase/phosphoglycerate dehydrogenase-like enzyme/ribulose-5-phosphate 4-epimerase/fuculose-1-phosphate aldolase/putative sterol carrier protein
MIKEESMPERYLMGLDVGGGGGRCLLANAATGEIASVFQPWSLPREPEAGGFAFRLDTDLVWRTLGECAKAALAQARIEPSQVAGVAATSMRHSIVAIDKKGRVLLAAPNRDSRAVDQGMGLAMERGEEIYRITGHAPNPIFMAARLMWLKEIHPATYNEVHAAVSISDWIGYMLSGELASEPAQAAESLLFDLKSRQWASTLIKSLGLSEKILPPLKPAGSKLGKLTKEAAANLGLVQGIPVAVGGPDTQCGLLGSGVVASGQVGVVAGTTTPVQMAVEKLTIDPEMRIWTGLHVIPGLYVLESNAGQMGSTLEWVARLLHSEAPNPVARLAAEAETSVPGAHGIHSTIGAAVFNASALEPPVDDLTFSSIIARMGDEARADVARAVLEGMAYAVRANLDQIVQISGEKPGEVCLGGGITRSAMWTATIANLLNCHVRVAASAEATALGAAICAGAAGGLFSDLAAGAKALARPAREDRPDPQLSSTYQALYADWQSLRQERRPADMVAATQITQVMLGGTLAGEGGSAAASFRPKIYIAAEVDELALRRLGEIGEVTYKPYRTEGILLTGDDLVNTLLGYQVFVTEVDIVDAACLLKLPDLRLVVVCRGNPVNVDIEACTAACVPVTNTPARNADAVADLAMGFLLMQARQLQGATSFLRQPGGEAGDLGRMGQAHEEFLGVELWRKTIGLIGGGAVGRKVAARLLPFGARVLLFDPFVSAEGAALMGAEKVPFERLLSESDFVSLHAAVTDGTRGMMNAAAFERMKPGAFLVNTARAALIDQEALLAALRSGKLGGFATDVFPVEPPGADDPLLAFPNVVATPHVGGNTQEVAAHQGEIVCNELKLLLAGQRPKHILNPAALESFSWLGERKMDEARLRERAAGPGPGATDLDLAAQKEEAPETKSQTVPAAAQQPASVRGNVQAMDTSGTRQKMTDILLAFTSAIAADPEMADFARGKKVVFNFTIKDLDQSFFLSFIEGKVGAGLGDPPREPDVKLKMAADTLDGMFTGRVNATRAATSGKLSFSGDTGKAMAFMRIQRNMSRLYTEARKKVGDPGDLTRLGVPAGPAAVPGAPGPAPSAATALAPQAVPSANATGRQKLIDILKEFTASIAADEHMASFAKGKNVVFNFTIKDLDQSFFLSFIEGKVGAGLGEPLREPDVKLRMSADVLDGMFTGRINATKAATSGKLSFSGDTGKAMAFMRIQGNMSRLYSEARRKIGDPGDLTKISAAAPVPAAAVAPMPAATPIGGQVVYAPAPPAVPKAGDVRDQILMVTNELYAKGLITSTGGNVSARCDDNPNEIWITPSAIFKGDLRPDMMVRIDLEGRVINETDYTASSERRVHCSIYKNMPDVSAVVHSHAPQATLMALTGTKFQPISADAAFFGDIPVVPFIMPGTDELGDAVSRAMLAHGIAVLMQNHGLVVAGSSLRRAADMTDMIEVTAYKILTCKLLGIESALLPEDVVKQLKEIGGAIA